MGLKGGKKNAGECKDDLKAFLSNWMIKNGSAIGREIWGVGSENQKFSMGLFHFRFVTGL